MKKSNIKKVKVFKICIAVMFMVAILIQICLYVLKDYYDIWLLIGNINQNTIGFGLRVLSVILLCIWVLLMFSRKWKKVLAVVMSGVILFVCTFYYTFSQCDPKYFYFNSPNGVDTIVVEEESWLLGGWSNFYLRKNLFFIKDLKQSISTDDGYRPFTNGDYNMLWVDSNSVEISYGYGQDNIINKDIIKLK